MRNKVILAMILATFSFLVSPTLADTTFSGDRIDPCKMAEHYADLKTTRRSVNFLPELAEGRALEACAETLVPGDHGTITSRMCMTYFSAANAYEDAAREYGSHPNKRMPMIFHAHAYDMYLNVATDDCGKTLKDQANVGADKAAELIGKNYKI